MTQEEKPVYNFEGIYIGDAKTMHEAKLMLHDACPKEIIEYNAGVHIGNGFYEACFYTNEMPQDLIDKYELGQ
jgi:hypothetical protein